MGIVCSWFLGEISWDIACKGVRKVGLGGGEGSGELSCNEGVMVNAQKETRGGVGGGLSNK